MRVYSGFNLQKKVQQRKAQTGGSNNVWKSNNPQSTKRKSQFNKVQTSSIQKTHNNEKLLRFLSFCTFLCVAGLGSQLLLNQPNFQAEAAGPQEVTIFTVYRSSQDSGNTNNNIPAFELIAISSSSSSASSSSSTSSTARSSSATSTSSSTSSTPAPTTYKVKAGDNLSTISYTFKVDINLLKQWNNITDPRSLRVGQELIIKQP